MVVHGFKLEDNVQPRESKEIRTLVTKGKDVHIARRTQPPKKVRCRRRQERPKDLHMGMGDPPKNCTQARTLEKGFVQGGNTSGYPLKLHTRGWTLENKRGKIHKVPRVGGR